MGILFSSNVDLTHEELLELKSDTGFNDDNIRRLFSRFQALDKDKKGYLVRSDFQGIPELLFNPLRDRIIGTFFTNKYDMSGRLDFVESQRVYFEDFVRNFSIFRPVSSNPKKNNGIQKEKKVRFLFDMIDLQRTGYFSKEELFDVLELMLGIDVAHAQLLSIVDRVIQEADENCDGLISFEEFQKAVENLNIETKMAFVVFQ